MSTTTEDSSGVNFHSTTSVVEAAREAREDAYAPYSEYKVGAAIQTDEGLFTGANVEVSGRSTSVHAEMMAMFTAIVNGATSFCCIAISHKGDEAPCALCMHTLSEFVDDLEILVDTDDGYEVYSLKDEYNNAYRPMGAEHHDHH